MKIAFFNIAHECLAISLLSAIAKKEGHDVKLLHTPTLFKDGYTREFTRLARFLATTRKYSDSLRLTSLI